MKIVYFGSAEFSANILERLSEKHEVLLVVTSPDAVVGRKQVVTETAVADKAKLLGLMVAKPKSLRNNPDFTSLLKSLNADVCVLFAYGKIIPSDIINITKLGIVNIHPSLLPRFRGPSPIVSAVMGGENETGVTIMLLDEQMDHGPILAQAKITIGNKETASLLTERILLPASDLLLETLDKYSRGLIVPKDQNHSMATYTKMTSKEDGRIDWNRPAKQIFDQWRAFHPWPGVWTMWNDLTLKITECDFMDDINTLDAEIGQVTNGGQVICGDGFKIQIHKLTPSGKKNMSIEDFIRGNKNFIASVLK